MSVLDTKGKLLDVGAATGHFLELARKNGWEASGIEISKYAAKKARKKGLEIAVGDFENHEFSENCFDAVTFWDVLEHFGKPDLAFKQARKILRTGGILAINTPDSRSVLARIFGKRWHAIVPPNHLNLFNCDNLKAVLEKNGFELRAGDLISFVKVVREPHVKPVELACKNEIDVDKYVAYLHSTFDQVLDALGLSFDEIIGLTKLERFLG